MQLLVMSQNEIEDYNMQENKYGSIVISISDIGGMEPFITPSERNKILKVLSLKFNDTEKEDGISGCIEDKHVEAIYNFILDYLEMKFIPFPFPAITQGIKPSFLFGVPKLSTFRFF